MSDDCIFCKILAGSIPSDKVYENEQVYAFNDLHPRAPTHILIIPKTHYSTLNDMIDVPEVSGALISAASHIAKDLGFADNGYRTIFNCNADGGQEVYHVHLHLLGGRQMAWPPG